MEDNQIKFAHSLSSLIMYLNTVKYQDTELSLQAWLWLAHVKVAIEHLDYNMKLEEVTMSVVTLNNKDVDDTILRNI